MSKLDDIRTVAYEVDAYANAVEDVRYLLSLVDAVNMQGAIRLAVRLRELEAENSSLLEHLHEIHHCQHDLTSDAEVDGG